jgi:transcriptional regulator with GAF, ATPase, and Fis domain
MVYRETGAREAPDALFIRGNRPRLTYRGISSQWLCRWRIASDSSSSLISSITNTCDYCRRGATPLPQPGTCFLCNAAGASAATDPNVVECEMIAKALANCWGNKSKAAVRLGISRTQLYVRLRKYQLS